MWRAQYIHQSSLQTVKFACIFQLFPTTQHNSFAALLQKVARIIIKNILSFKFKYPRDSDFCHFLIRSPPHQLDHILALFSSRTYILHLTVNYIVLLYVVCYFIMKYSI